MLKGLARLQVTYLSVRPHEMLKSTALGSTLSHGPPGAFEVLEWVSAQISQGHLQHYHMAVQLLTASPRGKPRADSGCYAAILQNQPILQHKCTTGIEVGVGGVVALGASLD